MATQGMKVKIFQDRLAEGLEREVNEWLEKHLDITIHYVSQSQGVGTRPTPVMLCLWYSKQKSG